MGKHVEETATAVVRAIGDGDWETIRSLCAPGYVHHAPGVPRADVDRYIETLKRVPRALPDIAVEIDQVVSTDRYATLRYTVRGHFTGDFHGIPGSGAAIELPVLGLVQLADGRLIEGWYQFDSGVISQAAAAAVAGGDAA